MTRGEKLNNPFNLEANKSILWNGEIIPGSDPVFCEFETPIAGLRAGYRNIFVNYQDGINTIEGLITKYAPPSENNTAAYINAVCVQMNCKPKDALNFTKYETLMPLGRAIIRQEQGKLSYSQDQLDQALAAINVLPAKHVNWVKALLCLLFRC